MGLSGVAARFRNATRTLSDTYRRARYTERAGRTNPSSDEAATFARCYRSARLDPNLVLYQAHGGAAMACNPYAIFRELLADPEFLRLTHVWVLDSDAEIRLRAREYAGHPNVRFVRHRSPAYLKALTTATYLIQNTTFPSYFTKRPSQVYVSTWHSAGAVKKMGFDLPHGNYSSRNVVRNLMMADYIVSPNELMTSVFTESYRLRGLYGGRILEFGYPRNDVTLKTPRSEAIDELRQRGVTVDPDRKIILYAPTWRGTLSNIRGGADELERLRASVAAGIDTDEYQILIKPHQYHYSRLTREEKASGRYIPRQFNANRLLAAVDVLISDYSSIFFDFMVTDRPVLFFIPDLAEYTAERGIYFRPGELPGPVTADPAEIATWINDLDSTVALHAERYARMKALACTHEDGGATRRTIDVVFRNRQVDGVIDTFVDPAKKRILLYASDLDSTGATEELLALVAKLDRSKYDVSVAGVGCTAQSRENVERIANTRVLARAGGTALTRWEAYGLEYVRRYGLTGPLARLLRPQPALRREWLRSFGDADFDLVVDCSRYPTLFPWVAGQGSRAKLAIWQHTEVSADLGNRAKWQLSEVGRAPITRAGLTAVYRAADAIISPSREVMESEQAQFGVRTTFNYAESLVDAERVRGLLAEAEAWQRKWQTHDEVIVADVAAAEDNSVRTLHLPDTPPAPDSGEPYRRFVTMGSLSPEKNLANLVLGFGAFSVDHPNSRLFIIGDGPAAADLKLSVARPDLAVRVSFTGHLRNPFTVLGRCDCFVLPSVYEGFNLSVPEARLVGLPIILADFGSAPSVSVPDGQYLTGSTPEELHAGLQAFVDGQVPAGYAFDVDAHNAAALAQWERLLDSL